MGLIEPLQNGRIEFDGLDIQKLSEAQKNLIRRFKLGFIFQNFHLIESLNVYENIEFFLNYHKLSKYELRLRIQESLEFVQIQDQVHKKPLEMSGGQRQRLAIARALAKKPQVIIADEPTSSLDQKSGFQIMSLLKSIQENYKVTLIICSHDPMVMKFAQRLIFLKDGKITIEEKKS
jgi:putative ABC transport system ATP-binding protein